MHTQVITAVLVDEDLCWSRTEICQRLNISKDLFDDMEEQGLLDTCIASSDSTETLFKGEALLRMEKAFRLHRHLGVNLPGVVLVLELLDELEILRKSSTF